MSYVLQFQFERKSILLVDFRDFVRIEVWCFKDGTSRIIEEFYVSIEHYENLKQFKDSQVAELLSFARPLKIIIPPSENTSNKSELVGVADSVGEALSTPLFHCDNCLDLPEVMRCSSPCEKCCDLYNPIKDYCPEHSILIERQSFDRHFIKGA